MKVCVVAEETVFYALVMPSFLFRTLYIRNLEWPAASLDINFKCRVFASVVEFVELYAVVMLSFLFRTLYIPNLELSAASLDIGFTSLPPWLNPSCSTPS